MGWDSRLKLRRVVSCLLARGFSAASEGIKLVDVEDVVDVCYINHLHGLMLTEQIEGSAYLVLSSIK